MRLNGWVFNITAKQGGFFVRPDPQLLRQITMTPVQKLRYFIERTEMQIELTGIGQQVVEKLLAEGQFQSANDAVEGKRHQSRRPFDMKCRDDGPIQGCVFPETASTSSAAWCNFAF